jgi:hypothetical protein
MLQIIRTLNTQGEIPRSYQQEYEDAVLAFDREMVAVELECGALNAALKQRDPMAVGHAACDLASAWLLAEAAAIRIMGGAATRGNAAARFAQLALRASNHIVADLFGRALAETSGWVRLDPRPQGLPKLRGLLCQLCARIDFRTLVDGRKGYSGAWRWECAATRAPPTSELDHDNPSRAERCSDESAR